MKKGCHFNNFNEVVIHLFLFKKCHTSSCVEIFFAIHLTILDHKPEKCEYIWD